MNEPVRRRTERNREWRAWRGTIRDLERLGSIAQSLSEERKEAFLEEKKKALKPTEETPNDFITEGEFRHPSILQLDIERISDTVALEATLKNGGDSSIGPPDAVLPELDRRSFTEILFSFSIEGRYLVNDGLKIAMRTKVGLYGLYPAVELEVTSPDTGWANKAFAMLSEEIDKGRVWWSPVHLHFLRMILGFVLLIACSTGLLLMIPVSPSYPWLTALFPIVPALVLMPLFLIDSLFTKIFPNIELSESGDGQSQGTKTFYFIGGVLLSILVGVLVNRIS